jgi:hypothetical protein
VISGNLVENSDRETKETIEPVDTEAILEQVAGLPIATWTRIGDPSATRHVGPMAQDFYDLFGVGVDERHISTIDTSGVALAAIQGLYEKLSEELARKKAQLDAQNQQIRALQDELQRIKDRLK